MTPHEQALGDQILDAFLKQTLGWKYGIFTAMAPAGTEDRAVKLIVETADAQPGDVPAKEHAAALALYKVIADYGQGGQVTSSQCAAVAHAVYQAVLKSRATTAG